MLRTIFVFLLIGSFAAIRANATDITPRTLDNLQTAFAHESNLRVQYLAFAKKADEEGYGNAASLFRAAARSEQIHANNIATAIKKLGAVPQEKSETPIVESTQHNIEIAIKAESYGRDTLYPAFWKQARSDHDRDAMRVFTFALSSQTEHAKLFNEALKNLDSMRGKGETYYVCTVCGYTTKASIPDKCPSCKGSKDGYEAVR